MSRLSSRSTLRCGTAAFLALGLLAGCNESGQFVAMDAFKRSNTSVEGTPKPGTALKTVERDVEAPEVFSATEAGLWDGRPSLGGVWVAHPDVSDPERVIIRNTENDQFVVGALFRRERDIPGPRIQISSDAAEALGMLAGAPAQLNVTALRKEEVSLEPEAAPIDAETVAAPADVSTTTLDPIESAAAALDAPASPASGIQPAAPLEPTPAAATTRPTASSLDKPFIQIGIFSIEANAERTAKQMRGAGVIPTVKSFERDGKPFWRVVVGPAGTASERSQLLKTIKGEGFTDAYAVTN
ncbi:SPOR domain-containing protein [Tateyamaria sp. ANG-S1]|uniref:SPOR domain-containing protein n=1 Tax=Tateyamaria sp. ANG-S1 TaxID=1577905 RepID=UPI00057E6C33|nr:SPOR domain-containing protein [Tateyamaria sp. ANG-S1]KIC51076.1 sporulation domain-containing protein [Tateyamaria sp. ANG-S1]